MIWLYAILDNQPASYPGLRGFDDRPLEILSSDSLAAAFTRHDESHEPRFSTENALKYESIVEQLMQPGIALLPARFGTRLADESDLRAALDAHRDEFVTALQRVRGCVEMGIRIVCTTPSQQPVAPASTGSEYMAAKLAQQRQQETAKQRAEELIHLLTEKHRWPRSTRRARTLENSMFSSAYLVPTAQIELFRSAVREAANSAGPDVRILCTGPWPPYHFTPDLSREAQRSADESV
jgi:hypothetical protein